VITADVQFHNHVGKVKGRIRRIAIAAVAGKLLIALWRYLATGLVPDGAILKF
jgi:transposase